MLAKRPGSNSNAEVNIMLPTTTQDITTKATETQILQALVSLAGLPSRQADDADLDRKMYQVALNGVSRYALNEAVKAVVRGGLGHTFFPSPVELRQQCEKAMEPHYREAERVRIREAQARENREFDRTMSARSPEAVARVKSVYEKFCEGYRKEAEVFVPTLDPELVAQVPDNPKAKFHRANSPLAQSVTSLAPSETETVADSGRMG